VPLVSKASPHLVAAGAALFGLLSIPMVARTEQPVSGLRHIDAVEAEFRGCDAAGWCRFQIDSLDPPAGSLYRVRPDAVARMPCEKTTCVAVRDRLNTLLANMIHQAKRIVLHDLRELDDGTFAATVTVNGQAVASDPILVQLRGGNNETMR
jgi:hypothetical protein